MKLRTTLILMLCLSAIVPIGIFWFWPYSKALETEITDVKERHLVIAKNLAGEMERYYIDLTNIFDVIVNNIDDENLAHKFSNIFDTMNIRHICVANIQTGVITKSIQVNSVDCPEVIPTKRLAKLKTYARQNETALSGVLPIENYGNAIFVVHQKGDKLIFAAISSQYIRELGRKISFGERGHAAIVDQHGRAISHPRQDWQDNRFDMSKLSVVKNMLSGKTGVEIFFSPALKAEMVAGYTHVKGAGWGVMVPQPLAELKSKAFTIKQTALLTMLLGSLAALGLAIYASTKITRPLEKLVSAMHEIGKGNYGGIDSLSTESWVPRELVEAQKSTVLMARNIRDNLAHVSRQSKLDHFTGLINRETFMAEGAALVKDSLDNNQKGAYISIDMNSTQDFNDFHGHKVVDVLIKKTASEIAAVCEDFQSFLRVAEPDIHFVAARTGGDKFSILIHGSTDNTSIAKFLSRLTARLFREYQISNNLSLRTTSSIGVAYFPHDSEVFEELARLSETALVYSQKAGKGQVVNVCSVIREKLVAI